MIIKEQIEALKAIGNEWQAYDKHRIYFNDLEKHLGLEINLYKSGNIMSASLNDTTISNSEAKRILGRLVGYKIWYDVAVDRFMSKGGNLTDDESETILDSIRGEAERNDYD